MEVNSLRSWELKWTILRLSPFFTFHPLPREGRGGYFPFLLLIIYSFFQILGRF